MMISSSFRVTSYFHVEDLRQYIDRLNVRSPKLFTPLKLSGQLSRRNQSRQETLHALNQRGLNTDPFLTSQIRKVVSANFKSRKAGQHFKFHHIRDIGTEHMNYDPFKIH